MKHAFCRLSALFVLVLTCSPSMSAGNDHQGKAKPDLSWRPDVVVPTRGEVWPLPLSQIKSSRFLRIDRSRFSFNYDGSCGVVRRAIKRYRDQVLFANCNSGSIVGARSPSQRIRAKKPQPHHRNQTPLLDVMAVTVFDECEDVPQSEMTEDYRLVVSAGSNSFIAASTVWGALRALETFSQLLYSPNGNAWLVNETEIHDEPRFSHRGLLIDTSRHFLPLRSIMDTLDAMTYNKMNVLHWHIVDDQSFPFVSKTFPNMSEKGAFDPDTHVYMPEHVQYVISEAAARGIRVMVEFDTPGHTRSWGEAFPGILTTCYKGSKPSGELGPIDPTKNSTYAFLKQLFTEVAGVFPDGYIHLGGDEVDFYCWKSNPNIKRFMRQNGIAGKYKKLEDFYVQRLLRLVQGVGKSYVVWQEVFDHKVKIAPDTVVQVWLDKHEKELEAVTAAGFHALLSSCWYLDYIDYGSDWKQYYDCDPHNFTGTDTQKSLVLGGEACIWAEFVDATNLISRTWPRACAAAERLWSAASVNNATEAAARFEEQRCRMLRRGLRVEPENGPGYCECDSVF